MKKVYLCFLTILLNLGLLAQECCNISPLGEVGGEDPQPNTGFGIALGDIDGDGDGDMAVHSAYENTYIFKFVNGTYQLSQTISYVNSDDNWQYGLNLIDIDNDGDRDLVTTPFWSAAKMFVYKNNGSGTFSVWQQVSVGFAAYNKAMGDVDNDGDIDIVIASGSGGSTPLYVYKNNGSGTFTLFGNFAGEGGRTVTLADVDNDGDRDALVATYFYGTGVRLYRNNGNGTFTMDSQIIGSSIHYYVSVAAGDFNSDGKIDFATGTYGNQIEIYKNLGNGYYTLVNTLIWEQGYQSYFMQLRIADIDMDGRKDIVAGAYSGGVSVWRNKNNDFEFNPCYRSELAGYNHGMDVGDINNDGKMDFVGSEANDAIAYVFINNGQLVGTQATASNSGPVCAGQNVQLFASPSGSGITYSWSGPNSYYSSQQNPLISNVTSNHQGTYTVLVKNSLCYNKATTNLILHQTPIANAGADQSLTYNSSTQLNGSISGGSGSYTIQWSPAHLLNNPNVINPTTVNLTQTTTFTLSVTDNNSGCSSSDDVLITITGTALSAHIQAQNNYVCAGQSIQLTALGTGGTGNYTYLWSSNPTGFSSTNQIVTVSPSTNTTYYVTINDGVTTAIAEITIQVYSLPSAQITTTNPVCNYDFVQLFAPQAQSYQWSGSNSFNSTAQNPIVGNLSAGYYYYYLTITDQYGCSNTGFTHFNIYNQPVAQAVVQPDSLNLYYTNVGNFYGINTGSITSWSWTIDNQIYTTQNVQHTFSQTGTYPVQLIVSNQNGCYDTLHFNYIVYSLASPLTVVINANSTNICVGQSAQIQTTVSGGSGLYTFAWSSNPAGFTSSSQNITVSPTTTTTYTVTVNDGHSTQQASITINVHQQPNITAWSNSPYCIYDVVQLFASDAFTYLWSGPNGFTSTQQNPIVGNLSPGSFQYTVTVSNNYGCTNVGTVSVVVNNQPIAQAFVLPDSLNLSQSQNANFYGINVGGSIVGWNWNIDNQVYTTQNVQHTFSQTGTYPVQFIVRNAQGCYDTLTFNYVVYNTLSMQTMQNLYQIQAYPSPVSQLLYILSNQNIKQIEILDISGRIIKSVSTQNNNVTISVSDLSPGLYNVRCEFFDNLIKSVVIVKQ